MNCKIAKIFAILFISMLILCSFFISINLVATDKSFYSAQYEKNNTQNHTQISLSDLDIVTSNLLDYITNKSDSLDMKVQINGIESEVFDSREKEHMIDVKKLFMILKYTIISMSALLIITLIIGIITKKKYFLWLMSKMFFKTAGIFLLVIAILAGMIAVNFNWFWTKFHEIFFTNDLWQLDPDISVMINMFPLEFFFAVCTRIIIYFLIMMVVYSGLSLFGRKLKAN